MSCFQTKDDIVDMKDRSCQRNSSPEPRNSPDKLVKTKDPNDADVESAPGQPANPRVRARVPGGGSAPDAPQSYVDWRLKVDSQPFTVFSAKKFPGLAESTSLSRIVAEQGCRVRIRRDVRMRRRDNKAPARFDDDDDEEDEEDEVGGGGPDETEHHHPHHFHHPPSTYVPDAPHERTAPTETPSVDPYRTSTHPGAATATGGVMPPPPAAHLDGHRVQPPPPPPSQPAPYQQQQQQQAPPEQPQQQQQQPAHHAREHASMYHLDAYRRASLHDAPPPYGVNAYPPPYQMGPASVPPQASSDDYPPRADAPPPGPYQYHHQAYSAVPPPPPPPHHPSMSYAHATATARGPPPPPSPHMSAERVERGSASRRPSMSGPAPAPPAAVSAYGYHEIVYARPPSVPPRSYGNPPAMPRTSTPGAHEHPLPPLNVALPVDAPRYTSASASATATTPPAPPSAHSLSSTATSATAVNSNHSARAPKRPYGTVFDASQLDASLRHGMRPSEQTHGLEPMLAADDEEEGSTALDLQRLRMQYKRADGTEIRRRPPHTQ